MQQSTCTSPKKDRYEVLSKGSNKSTIALNDRKQLLFPSKSSDSPSSLVLAPQGHPTSNLVPTMLFSFDHTGNNTSDDAPTISALIPSHSAPNISSQQSQLDSESHRNRLSLEDRIKKKKTTASTYSQQLKRYTDWWDKDQSRRVSEASEGGLVWVKVDAHPITALKASIYLEYDTNRAKISSKDGSEQEGTKPGVSAIKQTINALEYYRSHLQHEDRYRQCPESHLPLRNDIRIRKYEEGAAATDANERQLHMQARKAKGIQSETFTSEQLTQASMYYLQRARGTSPSQVETVIRDRSMLLATTTMAFRGDNIRRIKWSDIFLRQTRLPDIGLNYRVPTLVIITNQGKENSSGRLDEHGAFRHRLPEHCGIGALALHFFSLFHISGKDLPDFSPNYSLPSEEGIGFRSWYDRLVYAGKDDYDPMSLDNHIKRVNKMKAETGIDISKVTHAGRGYTIFTAREGGASVEGSMALGVWMAAAGGSYAPVYDRNLPVDAMLGAAGFNARRQESYFVARSVLDPPSELLEMIFPWIDAEKEAYETRISVEGLKAHDGALNKFFSILLWFRVILLQDAAVLFQENPDLPIFQYKPFNTPRFHKFSSDAITVISKAEEQAELNLKNLPEAAAEAMRGMFTAASMKQEVVQHRVEMTHTRMDQSLEDMKTLLQATLLSGTSAKKRKAIEAVLLDPPARPSPAPPLSREPSVCPNTSRLDPCPSTDKDSIYVSPPSYLSESESSQTVNLSIPITPSAPVPPTSPIPLTRTVSQAGNIYGYSTFELSDDPTLRGKQYDALSKLEATFPYERLLKHEFEWDSKHEEWIPKFSRFWTPPGNQKLTIEDVWREDKFGIDGMFSLQELNAKWDARWRRNLKPLKSEYSRRHKIVVLIERLAAKPNWNYELAFRFLHERFGTQTISARTLSDYLTPQEKITNKIIDASASYP